MTVSQAKGIKHSTKSFIAEALEELRDDYVSVTYYGMRKSTEGESGVCLGCDEETEVFIFGEQRIQVPGDPVSEEDHRRLENDDVNDAPSGSFCKIDGWWHEKRTIHTVPLKLCESCFENLKDLVTPPRGVRFF